jgi:hypothetical protein
MSNEKLEMSNGKKSGEQSKEPDEMTFEEKLALLSETEKAYVCGFIDRAIAEEVKREKGKVKREK